MIELSLVNDLKLTDEEFETIQQLSALNYTKSQIAMYMDIPLQEFVRACNLPNSKILFYLNKGKLESDFLINQKLQLNAESGNITAVQELNKMKTAIYVEQVKSRILYGED